MTSPMDPGEHTALLNGLRIRYRVAGRGPVLMVQPPGWGAAAAIYEATLAPLERDFTVVYHDPRGSGASESPADDADLHVGACVADLEALRAHLGIESFLLAGHSHGGLIALHYAQRHPRRVRALVTLGAQLVGVRPHPRETSLTPEPGFSPEHARAFARLEAEGGLGFLFDAQSDEEMTRALASIGPLYFRDVGASRPLADLLALRPIPVRTCVLVSSRDHEFPLQGLRAIQAPTLVVSGRYDMFCPAAPARTLSEALPHGRHLVFEQSGHFPWLEEPEAFFGAVGGFLARHAEAVTPGAS